jgi:hypothetical protein
VDAVGISRLLTQSHPNTLKLFAANTLLSVRRKVPFPARHIFAFLASATVHSTSQLKEGITLILKNDILLMSLRKPVGMRIAKASENTAEIVPYRLESLADLHIRKSL